MYLPWEWSRPIVAGSSVGTLEQDYTGFDANRYHREVTVEVLAVESVREHEGHAAVVGTTMWRVDLRLSAAPDQMFTQCHVELVDGDGARYGFAGGRRAADPEDRFYSSAVALRPCVPEDAPGPSLHPVTGELVESPEPRPESWELTTTIVMPDGYEPQQVRIAWEKPVYLVLEIP